MVYTCCVPGCKTGYRSSQEKEKIPLFKFPKEEELQEKWKNSIPRKNWVLSNSHRVCIKHFHSEDIQSISINQRNKQHELESKDLKYLRPKPSAIPQIFPNLPKYLSKNPTTSRTSSLSTASSRLDAENRAIKEKNGQSLQQDVFEDFHSFSSKLKDTVSPSGYVTVVHERMAQFYYIECADNIVVPPKLLISVVVSADFSFNAFVSSILVPSKMYRHLLSSELLSSMSELSNLLAICKSFAMSNTNEQRSDTHNINLAVSALQTHVSETMSTECNSSSQLCLIQFVAEQLQLLQMSKEGRRYSSAMITTSFLWQLTSTSLYKKMRELFILPSISRLRQLSSGTTVESRKLDLAYLELRTKNLTDRERFVVLMIDEVYTAQRIEYSNGAFVGLTEEGLPAKTVLTFMVQSICGKYKDVVCLIPVNRLDTALQRFWFEEVMKSLHNFFFVIAVSVDNHVCNRKMFIDLCGGKLQHSIDHPTRPGEPLFLLFDFTHNFKNIFNNFINKNRMHLPTHGYEDLLGETCTAFFTHIKHLYALEEHKTLKVAFSLKKASLNPSSIARTSPQHALSIFSESTVRGLKVYGKDHTGFLQTSRFIEFILNIWKIMSVKSISKSLRKRDEMCAAMRPTTASEDPIGLLFLKKAREIFIKWKASGNSGLTCETFLACIQSMGAVPELAEYLQKRQEFSFILPGKLMSDPIEARFGWYRQVNGGNFFMSIKQLLEAEKKIRSLSLIQQQGLVSASHMAVLDTTLLCHNDTTSATSQDISWLQKFFLDVNLDDLSEVDTNVAYFVSGYIARSISRRRKCSSCRELLIKDDKVPKIHECVPKEHVHLFEIADRGGLSAPTEFCFAITTMAVQYYTAIVLDDSAKSKLLAMKNQRAAFISAIFQAKVSRSLENLFKRTCSAGHSNAELIVLSAFNCFAKNELKRLNASNDAPPMMVQNRKIRKLSGKGCNKSN